MLQYEIKKEDVSLIINTNIEKLDIKLKDLLCGYFDIHKKEDRFYEYQNFVIFDVILSDNVTLETLDSNKKTGNILSVTNSGNIVMCSEKNKITLMIFELNYDALVDLKRLIIDCFAKYYESKNTLFVHGSAVVNKETGQAIGVFVKYLDTFYRGYC